MDTVHFDFKYIPYKSKRVFFSLKKGIYLKNPKTRSEWNLKWKSNHTPRPKAPKRNQTQPNPTASYEFVNDVVSASSQYLPST